MIIHDGKKIEVNIGGISKSQLEKILSEHSNILLEGLGKKLSEIPKQTIVYNGEGNREENSKDEMEIKVNSMEKIADAMSTVVGKKSDLNKKIGNIKTTKKDVSKTIDILKNLD